MEENNIIPLENPEENTDLLTSLPRSGARELISKAVHTELAEFLALYEGVTDDPAEGHLLCIFPLAVFRRTEGETKIPPSLF